MHILKNDMVSLKFKTQALLYMKLAIRLQHVFLLLEDLCE